MSILPNQLPKARWLIGTAVVFLIVAWLRDLISLLIRPINVQLLNLTTHSTSIPTIPSWSLIHFDLISFIFTAIVIGLLASWQVQKHEKEIEQLKKDVQWLSDKYRIYEPIINEKKETKKLELVAGIHLEPTTTDEVRFGEIQERLEKI